MKREHLRIFLFGLITFIGFNLLVHTAYAENTTKTILGKWKEIGSTDTIEFFKDGTIILELAGATTIGDYRFLDQNRIRVDLQGFYGMAGPQVTRISIENDKLIFAKDFLLHLLEER